MKKELSEAMAKGRRLKYLNRCLTAQRLFQEHNTETSVLKRVFQEQIEPVLKCSYVTFNNMLNVVNPQKEIDTLTYEPRFSDK